jgi:hypothetical protein
LPSKETNIFKSEYRNPKQTWKEKSQIGKIQNIESESSLFGTLLFGHLKLF